MRYIEIDGEKIEVHGCEDCPCYDDGDDGYGAECKHPSVSEVWQYKYSLKRYRSGASIGGPCPLREVIE